MDWGIDTPTGVRPLAEVAEPLREDLRKYIETDVADWQRTLKPGDFVVVAELGSPGFVSADVNVTYGTVTDGYDSGLIAVDGEDHPAALALSPLPTDAPRLAAGDLLDEIKGSPCIILAVTSAVAAYRPRKKEHPNGHQGVEDKSGFLMQSDKFAHDIACSSVDNYTLMHKNDHVDRATVRSGPVG